MRVLIADDDRRVCEFLTHMVEGCHHEVVGAISGGGVAVIRHFAKARPDLVLLDVLMPHCNGLTVCHALLSRRPETKVVLMSGMVQEDYPPLAGAGASAFLRKPMRMEDLQGLFDRFAV